MAIVHIAMFEALNAVYRQYESYNGIQGVIFAKTNIPANVQISKVSIRHAIAYAAHTALIQLYPEKKQILDLALLSNTTRIQVTDANAVVFGVAIGRAAAEAVMEVRQNDRSTLPEPRLVKDVLETMRSYGTKTRLTTTQM